jgi:pimeloyl-ACP methyl ester carboxylesterase
VLLIGVVAAVALTAASFGYNFVTDGPAPRPAGLLMAAGGGFDTRYLEWGATGTPIVLVPGEFETADTFASLGPVLGVHHRVYAIDLTGTGYSAPSPPYDAAHEAAQLLAFLSVEGLTGTNAPILVGHSAGAAVAGMAAVDGGARYVHGVVFLDGDALPFRGVPGFLGYLLVNPYRTSLLRIALSQGWLIRDLYNSQCGPTCPSLTAAGVQTWVLPLEQPGFYGEVEYALQHGIASMTDAQFAELRGVRVPKLVVYGADDSQLPPTDAEQTAQRIGAPAPVTVPGEHLTMISSPDQVAAAISSLLALLPSVPLLLDLCLFHAATSRNRREVEQSAGGSDEVCTARSAGLCGARVTAVRELHRREVGVPGQGEVHGESRPRYRQAHLRGGQVHPGGRGDGTRRRPPRQGRLGPHFARPARRGPQRDRGRDRRPPGDARGHRELGERQAGAGDDGGRHTAGRRSLPVLRGRDQGRGNQDHRDR